ncbi:hypothetical protein Taro_049873 [Colocasia esculenta]|uniref:Uncharacterized protein n=1 Tax=Colocasia esculenta TaxID=4460 RepID=A0A843XC94_COLES|nr:hypothetical protein [Colocasia esculenta]
MWMQRVAVAVGGMGVDANLRILQRATPESLKLPIGSKEWLDDRRTRGVAELREETSRRGAIPVGARGGLGVRARRTSLVRRPVQSRVVAVQGQHLQQSSSSSVV